jgi:hypothetical protein
LEIEASAAERDNKPHADVIYIVDYGVLNFDARIVL